MRNGTVHVVGAGLAGLSAATALAEQGRRVSLYESATFPGGRCRSYFDQGLSATIDNGNHLILSGNQAAMAYVDRIGARDHLVGPDRAAFDFVDLKSGERWRIEPNEGLVPWWIFDKARRVPGTGWSDYLELLRVQFGRRAVAVRDVLTCHGTIYERLWQPLLQAALNTEPPAASAQLARAVVAQTLLRGGAACRPLAAQAGLSTALIDPAIAFLERHGASIQFASRLQSMAYEGDRAVGLIFAKQTVPVEPHDSVVLAVPALVAAQIFPDLKVPQEHRAIVNGHFKIAPPRTMPAILGVIGGQAEWIFAYPDRISTTTSSADHLLDQPREELARRLWADIQVAAGFSADMPPWQIVKEKRATFAALPQEEARRPPAHTRWSNVLLAGDYTATGLPATIEGAIRSGVTAAGLVAGSSARRSFSSRRSKEASGT
ncbi:hydroxysqualene dehydroxylase HpnE [Methylovirgula sp. 4M-Z18]|uniref:hydroxysqualene dehydroxylase HpnE n=1 Tax=Methylovirgula sp. 4M-Z18 TaxID=2293567 RepID=UPI000E2FA9CE|nr:hydroxysqualene dehydroxylase HpnE [Methylovirgula sp. 4M-Z18]RFB76424.1 FAD-binding protein [Methylovirgula sp. 4M-Z18]